MAGIGKFEIYILESAIPSILRCKVHTCTCMYIDQVKTMICVDNIFTQYAPKTTKDCAPVCLKLSIETHTKDLRCSYIINTLSNATRSLGGITSFLTSYV